MSSSVSIDDQIYDFAIETASGLSLNTDASTVSQLLEVFRSDTNPDRAFKLLFLHAKRQEQRKELYPANKLLSDLRSIYSASQDHELLRSRVERYLIMLKWVFEFTHTNELKEKLKKLPPVKKERIEREGLLKFAGFKDLLQRGTEEIDVSRL